MRKPEIKIGKYNLKNGGAPFIIAEAGINHNGDIDKAFQMIKVAKAAGADAVKFQTFKAEEFVGNADQLFTYKSQGKKVTESMFKMFKRYEFSRQEWFLIKKRCNKEKIVFLSTPQNRSDLDLLLEIGIPAIKVGSDDFTNLPLLKEYAKTGLPMMISCGMADMKEVNDALAAIGALKGYPTVLMLCTSQYPTPPQDVNILKLKTLRNKSPMVILGFSDHTQGQLASTMAVAMGVVVFEKHFTLDHDLPGPDHWFSANPIELTNWVISIREAFILLGSPDISPTASEISMKLLARRSIHAIRDIKKGEKLTNSNLGLLRPGIGLPSYYLEKIIGLKAKINIRKNALIKMEDCE